MELSKIERAILREGAARCDADGFFSPVAIGMALMFELGEIVNAVNRLHHLGLAITIDENRAHITDTGRVEAQFEPFVPSVVKGTDSLTSDHETFLRAAVAIANAKTSANEQYPDEVAFEMTGKRAGFDKATSTRLARDLGDFGYITGFNSGGGGWLDRSAFRYVANLQIEDDEKDVNDILEGIYKKAHGKTTRLVDALPVGAELSLSAERVFSLVRAMARNRKWLTYPFTHDEKKCLVKLTERGKQLYESEHKKEPPAGIRGWLNKTIGESATKVAVKLVEYAAPIVGAFLLGKACHSQPATPPAPTTQPSAVTMPAPIITTRP